VTNLNIEKKQVDLVNESICLYKTCCHCLDLHKRGALTFSEIEEFVDDRGKSCLYRLKQMCHELFRNTPGAAYKEKFFDITVGYIFHEAMKLRECIYQLEYYKPQYNMLISSPELTPAEKKVIREFDALILKAKKRLNEGLKEVRTLLKDLVAQVKDLVKIYRDNYLLPRFLLENERSFIAMYGKKGYQDLLDDIYDQGRTTLIFKAALSYLGSEYYQVARSLFQKAIKLDRGNVAARFLFLYTSAFNCYFRNRFSMAKIFAEEALAMPIDGHKEAETYVQSLRDLLPDLAKEMGRAG
jgi:tetratricopeptide (TPR) repeat protein